MKKKNENKPDPRSLLRKLFTRGESAPSAPEKLELLTLFREHFPERSGELDTHLVRESEQVNASIAAAAENQEKLQAMFEELTAPPWHFAVFLGTVPTPSGTGGVVMHGTERRAVGFSDGVTPDDLDIGDDVLLNDARNLIVRCPEDAFPRVGETAVFERYAFDDGRLLVSARGEEFVVYASSALRDVELSRGDRVRCDLSVRMAFEQIAGARGEELFLEETPAESFACIGGLDREIEALIEPIRLQMFHRETSARFGLTPAQSVLLTGPPGVGKTLMAKALANWLAENSGTGASRFMNIKPAGLHSSWYGQTEANYREVFRVAREASEANPQVPVVLFLDEVDSIAAPRGRSSNTIDDRVLGAFMVELNGLRERGNIIVLAATNRPDAMDPALTRPGRLCDLVFEIPRPGREAAAQIFSKHLADAVPYELTEGEESPAEARSRTIEAAVARIYSANGDNEVATLVLRDGGRRQVHARELMSGAAIANVCQVALRSACLRVVRANEGGVRQSDVLDAVVAEIEKAGRILTPANCASHLSALPDDVDVVRIEHVERKVRSPHRYLSVA